MNCGTDSHFSGTITYSDFGTQQVEPIYWHWYLPYWMGGICMSCEDKTKKSIELLKKLSDLGLVDLKALDVEKFINAVTEISKVL